ncbi:XrtA system polysaccharide chain length determinant [Thalassotalea sp. PLHSN55]|uniref:XrtA system polysaccharide chain length determinant n=1 Tax=Thalassotalea sp. PLHSN55 TaxID=3435888 RepID=UPI003F82E9F7
MQEVIEQILDYLKGIWIKRRFIMISTWLICPLAWIYIAQLDDVYQSEARVYADTQSILGPLLKGLTVESNPDYQIQLMVKTLLSRPNIERITRMTDLDVQVNTPKQYEDLVDGLREDIDIRKTGARNENIFTITYEHQDPEMARNVVQSALTVFIENTLGENRSDSDSAQKFLDGQIKDYESRLLSAEARLTDFKQKYSDVLPDQYGGYYQKLTSTKDQLKAVELGLLETQTQLDSARAQLNNSTKPSSADAESRVKDGNSIQTTFDSRITELETNLDSLLLKYTDRHPDVIEVQKRLAHLNDQRKKEIESYLSSSTGDDGGMQTMSQNPVMQGIQIQVNQLENQVASFQVRAENYRQQVKDLESKIHVLPEIEAELVALNRGYDITKEKYEELLVRKETAQLAQQAEETTNKIQFKVIDPPRAPTEPTGPKRILFLIVATVFGIAVGVGISLLTSQINPVVTSSSQVSQATGIPVFGVIAATENLGLQQWHKRKTRWFILSNVLLLLLLLCFIAFALSPEKILAPLRGML